MTSTAFSGSVLNETDEEEEEEEMCQETLFQTSKKKREAFKNTKQETDVSELISYVYIDIEMASFEAFSFKFKTSYVKLRMEI